MSWIMAIIYPIVSILIVDEVSFSQYFKNSRAAFHELGDRFNNLALADILILSSGMAGAILAGITIKMLRNRGYRMF